MLFPYSFIFTQGTWSLEGNKLVGKFKRVDNGNELNAVREVIGGEMVQVGCKRIIAISQRLK